MTGERVVETSSYSLYLPEEALRERGPTVDALTEYLKAIEAKADAILARHDKQPGVSGSFVVGIKPGGKSKFWVVTVDGLIASKLESVLASEIESIRAPTVTGYNAFAINVDLWGGNGASGPDALPVPEAWKAVMPDGGMLPDMPLSILMPD